MMSQTSRSAILGRIKDALAANTEREDASALSAAIQTRKVTVRPRLPIEDVEACFRDKAEANLMAVRDIARLEDVPVIVAQILANANLPADVSVAPALTALPWPATVDVRTGKARLDERLTVSMATAGIAETGSVVLCSGDTAPSSLSFAAEVHVIVLKRSAIRAYLEDALDSVKALPVWPRAVNVISGPSRTADVAGIVVRPAHGPKAVHLLILGDAAP
jgi:L-lactate dehydrogenase complex protein LldG